MDRRSFIRGLLAVPAAVAAAQLGAPLIMGEEIQEELRKDLLTTSVGFSDATIFDNRPIWKSVARARQFYADEMGKALGREVDSSITRAAMQMVSEMDRKLELAEVSEDQKIILQMPKLVGTFMKNGKKQGRFASGVEQKTGLFGKKEIRVGYVTTQDVQILDANGRAFA